MSGEHAKRILDFWEVIDRIDPLPDPWVQTAVICETIERGNTLQVVSATGKEQEVPEYGDFMPPRWIRPPKAVEPPQSREEQLRILDGKQSKN